MAMTGAHKGGPKAPRASTAITTGDPNTTSPYIYSPDSSLSVSRKGQLVWQKRCVRGLFCMENVELVVFPIQI